LISAAPPKSRAVQVVDRTAVDVASFAPPRPCSVPATGDGDHATRKRKRKTTSTFGTLLKEVEALGASALQGKEKRDAQVRHLQSIGALKPKGMKTPLKMLFG